MFLELRDDSFVNIRYVRRLKFERGWTKVLVEGEDGWKDAYNYRYTLKEVLAELEMREQRELASSVTTEIR